MYRCSVCLKNTNFQCVCEYSFCPQCAKEELHDGTTKWCWHCKQNICKSFMTSFKEEYKTCHDCGVLLSKKAIFEEMVKLNNKVEKV